jgi:transposase InsO family protein
MRRVTKLGRKAVQEYFRALYHRYHEATKEKKQQMLDEFCAVTGYNRKYAIRMLNGPAPEARGSRQKARKRTNTYGTKVMSVIAAVWEAAGYPCSVRLKAILSLWLPWIRKRYPMDREAERQLLTISARQMDRRLQGRKAQERRHLHGRTKPGTLLKHHIPIRTDNWDVTEPGWTEVDTVSHSGSNAEGLFGFTVNQTDIQTGWVESRAILGKGEKAVVDSLDEMARDFPFPIKGIDSDNGSEFINWHLVGYCAEKKIQPFRGRPYKKDDNAHIEQKNWTHVRKLMGWDRYDSQSAIDAMNDLYRNELRLSMNLFLPSVKLEGKRRVGSRLIRTYSDPKTPLERVIESQKGDKTKIEALKGLRSTIDPFSLARTIELKLARVASLANRRHSPRLSAVETEALSQLSKNFPGVSFTVATTKKREKPR